MKNHPIEDWIEREFGGKSVAVRRETDPAIPGEPLMSMADAKDLVRRAVADHNRQIDRYGVALIMIREGCADPGGLASRILSEFDNGMRQNGKDER